MAIAAFNIAFGQHAVHLLLDFLADDPEFFLNGRPDLLEKLLVGHICKFFCRVRIHVGLQLIDNLLVRGAGHIYCIKNFHIGPGTGFAQMRIQRVTLAEGKRKVFPTTRERELFVRLLL